ncbi:MAG: tripartite tricarboxylate transporter substrate binding protein [Betaproteobacteria bacterium]
MADQRGGIFVKGVVGAMSAMAMLATAQNFPTKPMRLVVGYTPGGAVDFTARLIGQKMTEMIGQPVVIENRPGASTAIATEKVANAGADGYTLLLIPTSTAIQSALRKKLPYDLDKDFSAISLLAVGPFALIVHPSVPVKTVAELIRYAKDHSGQLSVASPGVGSANHLAAELFNMRTKSSILHVPYKGSGEAVVAVASAQTPMSLPSMASVLSLIEAGRVRALAVTSLVRVSSLPSVPTLDESGLPGFDYAAWYGVHAPAGVSLSIVNQLNGLILKILQLPEVKETFHKQGMESQASTPLEFHQRIKNEIALSRKLLQLAGIKPE